MSRQIRVKKLPPETYWICVGAAWEHSDYQEMSTWYGMIGNVSFMKSGDGKSSHYAQSHYRIGIKEKCCRIVPKKDWDAWRTLVTISEDCTVVYNVKWKGWEREVLHVKGDIATTLRRSILNLGE